MHPEAYAFIAQHAPAEPGHVAEIGSYHVNGSVRLLFAAATRYVGYDVRPGPGVDEVRDVTTWKAKPAYDTVVSTETLEHARDPQALVAGMVRMLRPDGLLLLTAAAPERIPHGQDGQAWLPDGEPYANIDPDALQAWLTEAGCTVLHVEHHPRRGDVYLVARNGHADSA